MDHVAETPNMLADGSADDVRGADASPPADDIDALLEALCDRRREHGMVSIDRISAELQAQERRARAASAFRATALIIARTVEQLPPVDLEVLLARAKETGSLPVRPVGDSYAVLARLACGPSESKSNVARIASVIRAMAERRLTADKVFGADKTFWAVHRELCEPAGKSLTIRLNAGQAAALHAAGAVTIRLVRESGRRTARFTVAELTVDQADAVHDGKTELARAARASSPDDAPDTPQAVQRVIGTGTAERMAPEPIATCSDERLSEVTECSAVVSVDVDREGKSADAPARRCAVRFETNVRKADRAAFRRLRQYGAFHEDGIWIGSPFEGLNDIVSRFGGTFVDPIEARNKRQGVDVAGAGQSRLSGRASRSGMLQSARGGAAGITHRSVVWFSDVDLQGVLSRVSSGPSSPRAVRR